MLSIKQAYRYAPYSLLPEEELEAISAHLHYEKAAKGSVLLVQEITMVENFRLVISGAARLYYEFNFTETLTRHFHSAQ